MVGMGLFLSWPARAVVGERENLIAFHRLSLKVSYNSNIICWRSTRGLGRAGGGVHHQTSSGWLDKLHGQCYYHQVDRESTEERKA